MTNLFSFFKSPESRTRELLDAYPDISVMGSENSITVVKKSSPHIWHNISIVVETHKGSTRGWVSAKTDDISLRCYNTDESFNRLSSESTDTRVLVENMGKGGYKKSLVSEGQTGLSLNEILAASRQGLEILVAGTRTPKNKSKLRGRIDQGARIEDLQGYRANEDYSALYVPYLNALGKV